MEKLVDKFIKSFVLAFVPSVIIALLNFLKTPNVSTFQIVISFMLAYFVNCVLIFYTEKLWLRFKPFRKYHLYEGIWIEIIPDFSRKISICKLEFKKSTYCFWGENFKDDLESVHFESIGMIENDDTIYYVTDTTETSKYEGLGRICFHKNNSKKNICTANGYFIDAKTSTVPLICQTFMIKIDQSFCELYLKDYRYKDIKKKSMKEIYKLIRNLDVVKSHSRSEVMK